MKRQTILCKIKSRFLASLGMTNLIASALADVFGRLRGTAVQRAGPNQNFECRDACSQVGVPDNGGREIRNDAAGCGRNPLWHGAGQSGVRAGCAVGTADLAISTRTGGGYPAVLRARESRAGD